MHRYFLALDQIKTLEDTRVFSIFTDELLQLHRGQGLDIYWRENSKCPTEEGYLEMVGNSRLVRFGCPLT